MMQPAETQPDPVGHERTTVLGDGQYPFLTSEQRLVEMIQDFNDPSQ